MGKKILIGIGESGCNIIEKFAEKNLQSNDDTLCLAVDTDFRCLEKCVYAKTVPMVSDKRLSELASEEEFKLVSKWLPLDAETYNGKFINALEMNKGAGLWRAKALFMMWAYFKEKENKEGFLSLIDGVIQDSDQVDIYVVASLAGGTGSGLFLPLTLFIEKYLSQKSNVKVNAKLCLLSAEIYKDKLTAEQGVKSSANAYGAIKELNSVYLACKNGGDGCPTSFKLGSEKDKVLGVLFDGTDLSNENKRSPFEKIYFFDKLESIRSLTIHENYLADALTFLVDGKVETDDLKDKDFVLPIAKLGLVKVRYPIDSLVNFISLKRKKDLFNKWLLLHEKAYKKSNESGFDQSFDAEKQTQTSKYAKAVVKYVNGDVDDYEDYQDCESKEIYECNLDEYSILDGFVDQINAFINLDVDGEIKDLLKETATFYSVNKMSKGKTVKHVNGIDQNFTELLSDFAKQTLNCVINKQDAFKDMLLDESCQSKLSLINNFLVKDNKAIDPVQAIINLSMLCGFLRENIDADNLIVKSVAEEILCQNTSSIEQEITTADASKKKGKKTKKKIVENKSNFEKWLDGLFDKAQVNVDSGLTGLSSLVGDNLSNCGGNQIAVDYLEKIVQVYFQIKDVQKFAFFKLILEYAEKLLNKYILYFNGLSKLKVEFDSAVKLALVENDYDNKILSNVLVSPEHKFRALDLYSEMHTENGNDCAFDNQDILEFTFNAVMSVDDEWLDVEILNDTLNKIEENIKQKIKNSAFYIECLNKNLVDNLYCANEKLLSKQFIQDTIMKIRKAHLVSGDLQKGLCFVKDTDGIKLDQKLYLLYSEQNTSDETNSNAQKLFYEISDGFGILTGAQSIPCDSIYLLGIQQGVDLYNLDYFNEYKKNNSAYVNCCKSLTMMKKQYSQMWNPFICKCSDKELPYVNPVKQEIDDDLSVKALIYSLIYDKFTICDFDGEKAYGYEFNGVVKKIMLSDTAIKKDKFDKLLFWLKSNELQEDLGQEFDSAIDFALDTVIKRLDGKDCKWYVSTINSLSIFKSLNKVVSKLAFIFKEDCGMEYYANKILEVYKKVLIKTCEKAYYVNGESYVYTYKNLKDEFIKECSIFSAKKNVEKKEKFDKWLKKFDI